MDGAKRGVRGGVTRRQVWQGFLDWFRPGDHAVVTSGHGVNSTGASIDLTAPLAQTGGLEGSAFGEGGMSDDLSEQSFGEEATLEIDEHELHEFLAADHDPIPADPVFREELRDQLWALVQDGAITRPKDH
jgi:hypothetical protein